MKLDDLKKVIQLHDELGFDFVYPGLRCSCGTVIVLPEFWRPESYPEAIWDMIDDDERREVMSAARGYERLQAASNGYLTHRAVAIAELMGVEVS